MVWNFKSKVCLVFIFLTPLLWDARTGAVPQAWHLSGLVLGHLESCAGFSQWGAVSFAVQADFTVGEQLWDCTPILVGHPPAASYCRVSHPWLFPAFSHSQSSSTEKALANQFLAPGRTPTTAKERTPATKTVHLQTKARCTGQMRSELLGTVPPALLLLHRLSCLCSAASGGCVSEVSQAGWGGTSLALNPGHRHSARPAGLSFITDPL